VVPAALEDQPPYNPFVRMAARVAGPDTSLLGTYWACGDLDGLRGVIGSAGLEVTEVRTYAGTARFGSPDELAVTEIEASPLAQRLTREAYAGIRAGARE